jgi:hypothetical protein
MKANGLPIEYKQRKGDVILLRAIVTYNWGRDTHEEFLVDVAGRVSSILIKRKDVVGIERLNFNVGEEVRRSGCMRTGKIVAINGDYAWIDFGAPEIQGEIVRLTCLERLDYAPQEPAEEAALEAPPAPFAA